MLIKRIFTIAALCCMASGAAFAQTGETGDVILNPQGEKTVFDKTYRACLGTESETYTAVSEIVIDNGNKYYFPEFVNGFEAPEEEGYGYVYGLKIGKKVFVTLPQTIYDNPDMGGKFNVTLATYDEKAFMGYPGYVPVENPEELAFTIEKDGSLTLQPLPEGQFIIVENEGMGCTMGIDQMVFAPRNCGPVDTIITDPEGETRLYKKDYTFTMFGSLMDQTASAEIVFGPQKEVYFKDLLSQFGDGEEVPHYYVKGILEGNTITVKYPQLIADVEGDFYIWLGKDDGSGNYQEAAESGSFTFTVDADGVITLDKLADDEAIVNMSEGFFMYSAEVAMKYIPISDSVRELDMQETSGTEYFTLDGRRVASPSNGIYLQRETFPDGSVRTIKKILD